MNLYAISVSGYKSCWSVPINRPDLWEERRGRAFRAIGSLTKEDLGVSLPDGTVKDLLMRVKEEILGIKCCDLHQLHEQDIAGKISALLGEA